MRWFDKLAVQFSGGVRLRLQAPGGAARDEVFGEMPGPPPDRILRMMRDIAPDAVGVVHLNQQGGRLAIQSRGRGFADGFEQRLRNVLVNS